MKYWVIKQAALRATPNGSKLLDLPLGARVEETGNTQVVHYNGVESLWREVFYETSARAYCGWMYAAFLEELVNEFPLSVVEIRYQTVEPNDAAQYMIWKNNVQYNLCGELCVCYITGDALDLMLTKWEAKEVSLFRSVFGGGRARGTSPFELNSMLAVYGYIPSIRLEDGFYDRVLERALVSPGRMAKLLETHRAIAGVKISGSTGTLQNSGVLHWVVVEKVIPDGVNRGWVELYNPFPNQMQRYSWSEFAASMGSPYGLLVKR